jgi:hypothetical protein
MYPYSGVYALLVDGGAGAPSIYSAPSAPSFNATQGSLCIVANATVYVNSNGLTTWTQLAAGSGAVTNVTASTPLASTGGAVPNISIASPIPIASGGTGTTTPAIVAGTNLTTSGSWPNQTINAPSVILGVSATSPLASSGGSTPTISLTTPLTVLQGGTGTTTPNIAQGANVTITGTWPNQTIAAAGSNSLQWLNIVNYGTHVAGRLTSNIVIPTVGSTVAVAVNTTGFTNSTLVSIWDYQYCFSGTVTSGGGTNSLVITCTTIFAGASGNTIDSSINSQAEGISTDDYATITAAISTAATAGGGVVYAPPSAYATSQTILLAQNVSLMFAEPCSMHPAGSVVNCFGLTASSAGGSEFAHATYQLPSVCFFTLGAGILILDNGCANYEMSINTIYHCAQGILVHTSTQNTTPTFIVRIEFNLIQQCTVGIKFLSTGSSLDSIQGMHIIGETIIACNQAMLFDASISGIATTTGGSFTIPAIGSPVTVGSVGGFPVGSYAVIYSASAGYFMYAQVTSSTQITTMNGTLGIGGTMPSGATILPWFIIFGNHVFEVATINGNAAGFGGIAFSHGLWSQMCFQVLSSFGSFGNDAYIYSQNGGLAFGNYYELSCNVGSGVFEALYDGFNGLASPVANHSPQNVLRLVSGVGAANTSGESASIANRNYAATTATNTRSSFNGGNEVYSQRFGVSMTFPATLTAGSVQDFYVYSPFASGSGQQPTFTPAFDIIPPVFLATVNDQHVTHANEIRIRLAAPNGVTSGAVAFGMIEIGM